MSEPEASEEHRKYRELAKEVGFDVVDEFDAKASRYAQHVSYLAQRSESNRATNFWWIDTDWPNTPARLPWLEPSAKCRERLARLAGSKPGPYGPGADWVRYLARISYCAEIGLSPEEGVDTVLHAEGAPVGAAEDALQEILGRAVNALYTCGMLASTLAIVNPKTDRSNIETAIREGGRE